MAKISQYGINRQERAEAIIQISSSNYRVKLPNLLYAASIFPRSIGAMVWDFTSNPTNVATNLDHPYPWTVASIGAGGVVGIADSENHPGINSIVQSGASTGGAIWLGNNSAILIAGQEEAEFIFQVNYLDVNTAVFLGFLNNNNVVSTPTNGCAILCNGTTLFGINYKAGVSSSTSSTYIISTNTWYRGKVVVNSNASRVDFYLYDESGNLLWTNNLTTNIPTAAGNEVSHGVKAYKTTAGALTLATLDYMSLYMPRTLTR